MCAIPREQGSMTDVFDQVRMSKGVAPLGDSEEATTYREDKAGASSKAGAAQVAVSGSAQPASGQVAPGVTVKGYGGKGTRNVRNTVGGDDYSDINKRKRKTITAAVGL